MSARTKTAGMTKARERTKKTVKVKCDPYECSNAGDCFILNVGSPMQSNECHCNLWHTGQHCELSVPIPVVVILNNTLITLVILIFLWYSAHRFGRKKIHVPRHRHRFVDHLHNHQKAERTWLSEMHRQEHRVVECEESGNSDNNKDDKESKDKSGQRTITEKTEKVETILSSSRNTARSERAPSKGDEQSDFLSNLSENKETVKTVATPEKQKKEGAIKVSAEGNDKDDTSVHGSVMQPLGKQESNTTLDGEAPEDLPSDGRKKRERLQAKQKKHEQEVIAKANKKN